MKNKVRYQSKTDLKLLCELHHLSKECVANYINYSTRTLERIEKENAVTTEYTARQLCDLYNINYNKFFIKINKKNNCTKYIAQIERPDKVDDAEEYYLLYVRRIDTRKDCIAGKVMWIENYGRHKERRVLRPINVAAVIEQRKDIQIINNGYEWVIWYYNLIIGKMYHVVVSKRCMKECLRFCLDEIIVSPKDLMIYDGATDIAFLGTKKRQ